MSFQGIAKPKAPFAVETLADLGAMDATGVQLGHRTYVTSIDAYFALVLSSASPDSSTVIAVDGGTGLRWRKDTGGGSPSQEGAALAWLSQVADFVATKNAALVKVPFWSPCDRIGGEIDRAAPGGTGEAYAVRIAGSNFLKLRSVSGTTANSARLLRNRIYAVDAGNGLVQQLVANCRTTPFAVAAKVIVNAVNNTCEISLAEVTDEATANTGICVRGATTQVNFTLRAGNTAVNTSVPIGTLGTTEHTVIAISDGTTVSAYIDFNPTAAATTPANTGANAAGHPTFSAFNGTTTTSVSADLLGWALFLT